MKPSNTIVVSPKYIEEKERQIADLIKKVERLQEQLKEANEVIKKFEKTEIGHKQKDGTYMLTVCGVIIDPEKRPTSALVQEETYFYDPRPLTKYLKKWGVK